MLLGCCLKVPKTECSACEWNWFRQPELLNVVVNWSTPAGCYCCMRTRLKSTVKVQAVAASKRLATASQLISLSQKVVM